MSRRPNEDSDSPDEVTAFRNPPRDCVAVEHWRREKSLYSERMVYKLWRQTYYLWGRK